MGNLTIQGRGAASNPKNRFHEIEVEREKWVDSEDPAPRTRFYRDPTRTIIATNDSPDVGFEASVNPYRGCETGCAYCIDGNTPILMADGSTRPIGDLVPGDSIYGTNRSGWFRKYTKTQVLAHWETRKTAYRVMLSDGTELLASGDHRFLTWRGWKFVTGRMGGPGQRPYLTLNDRLLGTGHFEIQLPRLDEYKVGYLCGMIRGDAFLKRYERRIATGHIRRSHRFRLALIDETALSRTELFLQDFGVLTRKSRFQEANGTRKEIQAIACSSKEDFLRIQGLVQWPRTPSATWREGFLAGIFDAEGSFSGGVLRIPNTDPTILSETVRSFSSFGFDVVVEKRPIVKGRRPLQVVRLRGGLKEHLRFFHMVDPAIRRKANFEGQSLKSGADLRVVSIEPLGKMRLYDITTGTEDFIANGVVSHNCYARPFHEYLDLSPGLDFETKIFVKEDAPALLRKELTARAWTPKVLVMSGVTDPYQPVERRLGITRGCLEVLAEFRNPVAIITKSDLVTRDIDLLAELAAHGAAAVNLSITTLSKDLKRVMEPRAALPERRLEAIRRLSEAGIPTGVNVAPVIPGLTDHEMPEILERAAEAGAVRAAWIMLRLPHAVKELFADWLARHFPDRREKVLNRLRDLRGGVLYDPRYGARMRGEGPFAEQVRQVFEVACRRHGLNATDIELSTAAFRRPPRGGQLGLFDAGWPGR
jgi:DNA repair photolyase